MSLEGTAYILMAIGGLLIGVNHHKTLLYTAGALCWFTAGHIIGGLPS